MGKKTKKPYFLLFHVWPPWPLPQPYHQLDAWNLGTRNISVSISSTAYYSGEDGACNTSMPFTDTLNGTLSEDNGSASGTCSHSESWSLY